ncbi:MAG: acyltransferase family protein [Planctomycetota bacterium]
MAGKTNPQKPDSSKPAGAVNPPPISRAPESNPKAGSAIDSESTYTLGQQSQPVLSAATRTEDDTLRQRSRAARREKSEPAANTDVTERLVSLDAFRGFIMMMLAAGGFGILTFSRIDEKSPLWQTTDYEMWQRIGWHFNHPAWLSVYETWKVSFWDLIQPSFMLMVGVAMPFSDARRAKQGQSRFRRGLHALGRSTILVLIGIALYSRGNPQTNWTFPNVLCQIGLGYFFAWCLLHLQWFAQIIALVIILVCYWAAFYFNPPPADYDYKAVNANGEEILGGSWSAWSKNANTAYQFDSWLLPKLRNPESDASAAHDIHSNLTGWKFALLPQENVPQLPTALGAGDFTSDTSAVNDAMVPRAIGEPPAKPIPTTPTDSRKPMTELQASAEPEKPARPGWIRKAFFSNPMPYAPNGGGYATLNFVPSIGTTLLGILCGQLLMLQSMSRWAKLGVLIVAAAACLGLGILAGQTICPIVKRIWTPSWVLFSGGYVMGMLALFYLLFDIAPLKILAFPLVVVGTNSILIYLLGETISGWMKSDFIPRHLGGLIEVAFGPNALDPQWYQPITLSITTFLLYWVLLLWLYRQKYFLRI